MAPGKNCPWVFLETVRIQGRLWIDLQMVDKRASECKVCMDFINSSKVGASRIVCWKFEKWQQAIGIQFWMPRPWRKQVLQRSSLVPSQRISETFLNLEHNLNSRSACVDSKTWSCRACKKERGDTCKQSTTGMLLMVFIQVPFGSVLSFLDLYNPSYVCILRKIYYYKYFMCINLISSILLSFRLTHPPQVHLAQLPNAYTWNRRIVRLFFISRLLLAPGTFKHFKRQLQAKLMHWPSVGESLLRPPMSACQGWTMCLMRMATNHF